MQVAVIQSVIRPAPAFPLTDEIRFFQGSQVKRDLRLYHIERCADMAAAELSFL